MIRSILAGIFVGGIASSAIVWERGASAVVMLPIMFVMAVGLGLITNAARR